MLEYIYNIVAISNYVITSYSIHYTKLYEEGVGVACAGYLEQNLTDGDVIGCSWGRNRFHVGQALRSVRDRALTVVQLSGGMNTGGELLPQKVMELMVSKLSAKGVWLNTPAVVAHLVV